jgi:hypothetical protein
MVVTAIRPVRYFEGVVYIMLTIPYLISIFKNAQQSIVKQVVSFVHVTAAQVDG